MLEGIVGGVVASGIVLLVDRFLFSARRSERGLRRSKRTWAEWIERIRGEETHRCRECGRENPRFLYDRIESTKRDPDGRPREQLYVAFYRCQGCGEEWREESGPHTVEWRQSE